MILEQLTKNSFGYYSTDLAQYSEKKIIVNCDKCGLLRFTTKRNYRKLCHSCSRRKTEIIIEPELLLALYWGNQYSCIEIGRLFECSGRTIRRNMENYDIPKRTRAEFSKILSEKYKGISRHVPHLVKYQYKKGHVSYCKGKKRPEFSGKNHPSYGKRWSEETRRKISEAKKGISLDKIHKENCQCGVCKMKRGECFGENHPNYTGNWSTLESRKRQRRIMYNRRRNLGNIDLWENPFPEEIEVDWHHINNLLVIPLPKSVHRRCNANLADIHRNKCDVWIKKLYSINILEEH